MTWFRRVARSIGYALASLPIGLAYGVATVLAVSFFVPAPLLGLGRVAARPLLAMTDRMAHAERRRARAMGWAISDPSQEPLDQSIALGSYWLPGGRERWGEVMYLALLIVLGPIAFAFMLAYILVAITSATWPIGLGSAVSTGISFLDWFLFPVIGIALLLVLGPATRGLASIVAGPASAMLGPSRQMLVEKAEFFKGSRDASLDSAEAERKRIERDLHDGVQARLTVLAMDIGRARDKLDGGATAEDLGPLLDEASDSARQALSELRAVARGVHASVLTDRGLDAALSSVVAKCPVPVRVQIELDDRPPPLVESAAYYVIAEALTNIGRHSGATAGRVAVTKIGRYLHVVIFDDGVGGADTALGSGLAGLDDRVRSVGGTLEVSSPLDGPTRLEATLPWPDSSV